MEGLKIGSNETTGGGHQVYLWSKNVNMWKRVYFHISIKISSDSENPRSNPHPSKTAWRRSASHSTWTSTTAPLTMALNLPGPTYSDRKRVKRLELSLTNRRRSSLIWLQRRPSAPARLTGLLSSSASISVTHTSKLNGLLDHCLLWGPESKSWWRTKPSSKRIRHQPEPTIRDQNYKSFLPSQHLVPFPWHLISVLPIDI